MSALALQAVLEPLASSEDFRLQFKADREEVLRAYDLGPAEYEALCELDVDGFAEGVASMEVHPAAEVKTVIIKD